MTDSVSIDFVFLEHGRGLPVPQRQSDDAAGLDLLAAIPAGETVTLHAGERALIPCGFSMALPKGFEAQVRPRSGLAARHGVTVLNAPGTIDADYRGEVKVLLINHGAETFPIRRGDRVAQLVVAPVSLTVIVVMEMLDATDRGEGGFGSTGVSNS